ncbi:hypothetical protein CXG81DRAFT_17650 [Caulochytrium protostelioides]|uniref:Protein kinase domain-containing protein n=1 Tax=Caulochytrium protostelioides TaxID=1555241 RepID=A0A4V1IV35_9FUNG|nr:hypothetical protein CXG81DRAFT_17650 [Caulochytrium protostelioides]|eukprot:RKP02679.1 hypothetical protein CXG81DRAFT_17650 [Caulochytrium protostelioides]
MSRSPRGRRLRAVTAPTPRWRLVVLLAAMACGLLAIRAAPFTGQQIMARVRRGMQLSRRSPDDGVDLRGKAEGSKGGNKGGQRGNDDKTQDNKNQDDDEEEEKPQPSTEPPQEPSDLVVTDFWDPAHPCAEANHVPYRIQSRWFMTPSEARTNAFKNPPALLDDVGHRAAYAGYEVVTYKPATHALHREAKGTAASVLKEGRRGASNEVRGAPPHALPTKKGDHAQYLCHHRDIVPVLGFAMWPAGDAAPAGHDDTNNDQNSAALDHIPVLWRASADDSSKELGPLGVFGLDPEPTRGANGNEQNSDTHLQAVRSHLLCHVRNYDPEYKPAQQSRCKECIKGRGASPMAVGLLKPHFQEGTGLDFIAKRNSNHPLASWELRAILHGMMNALGHLADKNRVHTEVRPENFRVEIDANHVPHLLLDGRYDEQECVDVTKPDYHEMGYFTLTSSSALHPTSKSFWNPQLLGKDGYKAFDHKPPFHLKPEHDDTNPLRIPCKVGRLQDLYGAFLTLWMLRGLERQAVDLLFKHNLSIFDSASKLKEKKISVPEVEEKSDDQRLFNFVRSFFLEYEVEKKQGALDSQQIKDRAKFRQFMAYEAACFAEWGAPRKQAQQHETDRKDAQPATRSYQCMEWSDYTTYYDLHWTAPSVPRKYDSEVPAVSASDTGRSPKQQRRRALRL